MRMSCATAAPDAAASSAAHNPSLKCVSFMIFFPCVSVMGMEPAPRARRRFRMPWFGLETNRLAVAAAVAGGDIAVLVVAFVQAPDELARAEIHVRIVHRFHDVAQRAQAVDGGAAHGGLDVQREVAV